ncbi:superoxide dismutase family protein [Luteimonas wenzhouensis]|jgi:Cu-Zn family superoxide dismutase|uniref:Superoxide dismutase family protein n=1 Tax=Luteimonas wenzhouensis TaxID=2599615 RepID=A0A5C5TZ06_9GAMM|nr:superoxide dismutase family protein [Luteimonas wenzhouensis]NLW97326.1 superoxide dismutase family protein [Xanthomonadaceae bacterium]TWT18739.1 superoxide dismutase family protein [Luteimonas wenzhouensis]
MPDPAVAKPVRSLPAIALLLLAACASGPPPAAPPPPEPAPRETAVRGTVPRAVANLFSASGSLVSGRVVLTPVEGGVRVRGEVGGLVRNGAHGLQVHERGDCSAVDARSAGRYFDPLAGARQDGAVAGDPGRIFADAEGVARVDLVVRGAVLGGGAGNDILGRALLVLGATPGAISARVACGVITAVE